MNTFEHQLAQAARQHKHTVNARLRVPANPRSRRLSAAWIASPIAAAFGLLVGLGIQLPRFDVQTDMLAYTDTIVCHDTVYQTLRDTIRLYSPRRTAKKHYAHASDTKSTGSSGATAASPSRTSDAIASIPSRSADTTHTSTSPNAQPLGRNIFEDGVDYSMLISCIY